MTLIILPVCSFALIWFVLLQKSTPPENTGLKIPHCSFSKLHCTVCQSQICNQVSRDTVEGQLVNVGPLITSKLDTHFHAQTHEGPHSYLWQWGVEKPFISFCISFTHTHRHNSAFLSAVFPDEGQWNSEVILWNRGVSHEAAVCETLRVSERRGGLTDARLYYQTIRSWHRHASCSPTITVLSTFYTRQLMSH